MKYRGLLVFAIILVWSWLLTFEESPIDLRTHTGIQTRLIEIIQNAVLQQRPEATAIRFDRMWTEAKGENQILATFSYIFGNNDQITEKITGKALISRMKDNNWLLDKVMISNNDLQFEKGLVIQAGP